MKFSFVSERIICNNEIQKPKNRQKKGYLKGIGNITKHLPEEHKIKTAQYMQEFLEHESISLTTFDA